MKRVLAAAVLALSTFTAAAQTNGLPPEQAPAGNPGKLVVKKASTVGSTAAPAEVAAPAAKPLTTADRRAARKARRAERVGPKPID